MIVQLAKNKVIIYNWGLEVPFYLTHKPLNAHIYINLCIKPYVEIDWDPVHFLKCIEVAKFTRSMK